MNVLSYYIYIYIYTSAVRRKDTPIFFFIFFFFLILFSSSSPVIIPISINAYTSYNLTNLFSYFFLESFNDMMEDLRKRSSIDPEAERLGKDQSTSYWNVIDLLNVFVKFSFVCVSMKSVHLPCQWLSVVFTTNFFRGICQLLEMGNELEDDRDDETRISYSLVSIN